MFRALIPCFAIALVAALCACAGGQTGSEGFSPQAVGGSAAVEPPPKVECSTDEHCHLRLRNLTGALQLPASSAARQLVGASCARSASCDAAATSSCTCSFTRAGSTHEEQLSLSGQPCALYGRSFSCLLPAAELAACAPGSCDCKQQCERAFDLLAADDARAAQVQERVARCENGTCKYVVALDDRCYAGTLPSVASPVIDCALSDDALLDAAEAASQSPVLDRVRASSCGTAGGGAVAGVPDKPVAECTAGTTEAR